MLAVAFMPRCRVTCKPQRHVVTPEPIPLLLRHTDAGGAFSRRHATADLSALGSPALKGRATVNRRSAATVT
jgi:hypothetical protein